MIWIIEILQNVKFQVTKVVPAMTEEVKQALIKNIRRRMTPQPLRIRADIELRCFQYDGVLHIKVSHVSFQYILHDLLLVHEMNEFFCCNGKKSFTCWC